MSGGGFQESPSCSSRNGRGRRAGDSLGKRETTVRVHMCSPSRSPRSLPALAAPPRRGCAAGPSRDCGSRGASGPLSWPGRARAAGRVYSPPLVCGRKEEGKNPKTCGRPLQVAPFLSVHPSFQPISFSVRLLSPGIWGGRSWLPVHFTPTLLQTTPQVIRARSWGIRST